MPHEPGMVEIYLSFNTHMDTDSALTAVSLIRPVQTVGQMITPVLHWDASPICAAELCTGTGPAS